MRYRNRLYLTLIILAEIIMYTSLTYGYFHTENYFQIRGLGDLDKYEGALIRFNIIIFFVHTFISTVSVLYLKNNTKIFPLIIIAVINFVITLKFFLVGIFDNYLEVREVNIFTELKLSSPYADIYYILPMVWAIFYIIYIYFKRVNKN